MDLVKRMSESSLQYKCRRIRLDERDRCFSLRLRVNPKLIDSNYETTGITTMREERWK